MILAFEHMKLPTLSATVFTPSEMVVQEVHICRPAGEKVQLEDGPNHIVFLNCSLGVANTPYLHGVTKLLNTVAAKTEIEKSRRNVAFCST